MRFLDLFAGIGGFRLGMEQAGHECVGFVEWDKYARKSYEAIHDTEGEWTAHDITTVTDNDIRLLGGKGIDVICGGFPCQAFSVAGKRGGFDDTRGTLFFEIARIAQQIKPRILLLENVKGLLSHEQGRTFGTILNTLDELGYDCEWQVLNSKNFGVPQNRERVFIVGHLRGSGGREVFPIGRADSEVDTAIKIAADLNHYGNEQMNRVYSVEGIAPTLTVPSGGGREHKIAISVNAPSENNPFIVDTKPKDAFRVYEDYCPTLQANDYKEPKKVVILVLTPDRAEKRQNGRRFKEDGEPSFTLTAQDKHGVLVSRIRGVKETEIISCLDASYYKGFANQERSGVQEGARIRKLTPRECFRLQGFPDWAFDKAAEVNSNSQLYKQAGNSVTVNVIHEIAKRLN